MSDRPHIPGPSRETLEKLSQAMPGMVHDLEEKRKFRGQKSAKTSKPTKVCQICGRPFDFKLVATGLPDMGLCDVCWKNLSNREIAFVSDNRFCFVDVTNANAMELESWRGKIVQCSVDEMDRLQLRFKVKVLEKQKLLENMLPPPPPPKDGQNLN